MVWRELEGPAFAGSLTLGPDGIRLDGTSGAFHETRELPLADIVATRIATSRDRLDGRPTLIIDLSGRRRIQVAAVAGIGVVREIGDALARLLSGSHA